MIFEAFIGLSKIYFSHANKHHLRFLMDNPVKTFYFVSYNPCSLGFWFNVAKVLMPYTDKLNIVGDIMKIQVLKT